MSDEFKFNISGIKKVYDFTRKSLKDKRVIWGLTLFLLLVIIIFSSWIRLQNLSNLQDSTTGEYIPLALDPFYFLRLAETISDQGGLPMFDSFRQPFDVGFTNEILPDAVVILQKLISLFNPDVSLQYVNIISPVIFFALAMIAFFFLIFFLTNSKTIALVSSAFLSVMPSYLYRTMAGFSDHESIGMFAFFSTLLIYVLSLKYLEEKSQKKDYLKIIGVGSLLGLFSAFTVASWGGVSTFVFLIIPSSFVLLWLIKTHNLEKTKDNLQNFLIFYVTWFVSSILFLLPYGFDFFSATSRVFLNPNAMLNGVVFLFIASDFIIIKYKKQLNLAQKFKKIDFEKYRILVSGGLAIIMGAILFMTLGSNIISFISQIISKLFIPIGTERVTLTVAENAQPFLVDWIAQLGKRMFWLFLLGISFVGFEISKGIGSKKHRMIFLLVWITMVFSVLFSRTSSSALLNGSNLLSKLVYFGGMISFLGYLIWIYFNEKLKIRKEYLVIFSWLFLMLIATRSSIRLFFVISPLAAFMIGFSILKLVEYTRKTKDDLFKIVLGFVTIAVIIMAAYSFIGFVNSTSFQAENTGPSANIQWQQSMSWVRENTNPSDVFLHWWDYGYWVQYLGERPVLSDGGHYQGSFRDHLIGRYVLTTPNPETALSFMKTNDASYLLIDPTDLGKYPAYSRIGSDDTGGDRYSQIPVMVLDHGQSQITENNELRFYQGGTVVDEDIVYNLSGTEIFLPQNNAFIGAVVLEIVKEGGSISIQQPSGIFVYNGQQIRIPLRYVYFNNQLIDFGGGLDSVVRIIPRVVQSEGVQIDNIGSVIYLSPKVKNSLFAQLYLLNDAFNDYGTINLAHSQPDPIIANLNAQGANLGEFVHFGGFRGPIKIWKINYPDNILEKEEFLRRSGEFAEFDGLQFTK